MGSDDDDGDDQDDGDGDDDDGDERTMKTMMMLTMMTWKTSDYQVLGVLVDDEAVNHPHLHEGVHHRLEACQREEVSDDDDR